jgi:hypothetical protein
LLTGGAVGMVTNDVVGYRVRCVPRGYPAPLQDDHCLQNIETWSVDKNKEASKKHSPAAQMTINVVLGPHFVQYSLLVAAFWEDKKDKLNLYKK